MVDKSALAIGYIEVTGKHDPFRVRPYAPHNHVIDQRRAPSKLTALADPPGAIRDSLGNPITSNDHGGFGSEAQAASDVNLDPNYVLDVGAFGNTGTSSDALQLTDPGIDAGTDRFEAPPFSGAVPSISLFGTAVGGWTSQDQYPRAAADVNGDGQADIVGFGAAGTYVSLNLGGDRFGAANLAINGFGSSPSAGGWVSQNITPRLLGDISLDDRADIIAFASDGVHVSLDNPDGTFSPSTFGQLPIFGSSPTAGGWTSFDKYPRQLGDVNGDGRQDIVAFASDGVYVSLANPVPRPEVIIPFPPSPSFAYSGFGNNSNVGGWVSQDQYPRLVTDVNGDGRADIVAFASDGVHVALAQPNGTFGGAILSLADFGNSQGWTSQNATPRLVADINGDGRGDIVGFNFDGVSLALGQTDGTFGPRTQDIQLFGSAPSSGGWTDQNTYPRVLADVTGDQRADIVGFGSSGVFVSHSNSIV